MKARLYIIPALLMLITACEEVIDFKGKEAEPKLVLYSLFDSDSLITVSLARSIAIFDKPYTPSQLSEATVRLFRDGIFIENLTYKAPVSPPEEYQTNPYSLFVSATERPVAGSLYRIEAQLPGFRPVSAEASLPVTVPIVRIDTITKVKEITVPFKKSDVYYDRYLEARVTFTDPPDVANYYRISVSYISGKYYGPRDEPYNPDIPVSLYTGDYSYAAANDPVLKPEGGDEDLFGMQIDNTYRVFSDALISGQEYSITLELPSKYIDESYYEFDHFEVNLQSISKDLYLYLLSAAAHTQTKNMPMSEPVIVYSNVTNGLGIVGAVAPAREWIRMGQYPVEGVKYEIWR